MDNLPLVTAIYFVVGWGGFALPFVPGLPVYLTAGTYIRTPSPRVCGFLN